MTQNLGNLFIEGSSLPLEDASDSEHVITNTGVTIDTNNQILDNNTMTFNGSSKLQIDGHDDFDLHDHTIPWTRDFWVKADDPGSGDWVFHIGFADYQVMAWSFYGGKHTFFCDTPFTGANLAGWNVIYGPVVDTNWVHCAVVYSTTDQYIRMYCDGVEVGFPIKINGPSFWSGFIFDFKRYQSYLSIYLRLWNEFSFKCNFYRIKFYNFK